MAGRPVLDLRYLKLSDPIFDKGMREDGPNNLNDPPLEKWDLLFNNTTIHGRLKIAGSSSKIVIDELEQIKSILGNAIKDIDGTSAPTTEKSKVEGNTRPGNLHGHEQ